MKHGITLAILGDFPFLEITQPEFERISSAKSHLLHALHIEDKFDIVLQNYADFEVELLTRAINETIFQTLDWSEAMGKLHDVGRRMINLLTTCRLYLDQIEHNFSEMFGKQSQQFVALGVAKSKEYDDYLGYRFMEALRNYVQHRGFPIHGETVNSERIEESAFSRIRTVVIPRISVSTLEKDGFKRAVLNELKSSGETCDIRPMTRQYVASIARINEFVRTQLAASIKAAETLLAHSTESYKALGCQSLVGLSAVALDDSGSYVETVELFDDFIKRRQMLMQKNRYAQYCDGAFVSNGIYK